MVDAEAPVKQKVTRVAEVQANTVVDTVNEVIAKGLTGLYAGSHLSTSVDQECYRHTDTLLEIDPETKEIILLDVMTEALVDAVGETLLEVKAKTLGDTQADVNA